MVNVTCRILSVLSLIQISDPSGTLHQAAQNCEPKTVQLGNLLSYACGNIDDITNCRNHFLQALRANNNQPSIPQLALNADIYFSETKYSQCAAIINAAISSLNGFCVTGYCSFVRCLRRVNSDILIDQCFSEATLYNEEEDEADQVVLYKNITSCILATARCSRSNPITGQPQNNRFKTVTYDHFQNPMYSSAPLYNALQINQAGDLRIIALPASTSIQKYFCPFEFNLRETSWMQFNC